MRFQSVQEAGGTDRSCSRFSSEAKSSSNAAEDAATSVIARGAFPPAGDVLPLAAYDLEVNFLVDVVLLDDALDDFGDGAVDPFGQADGVDDVVFAGFAPGGANGVDAAEFARRRVNAGGHYLLQPIAGVDVRIPADEQILTVAIDVD